MKKLLLTAALFLACAILFSFRYSASVSDDLWKQLGISQKEGTDKIKNSFLYGYLEHYGVRNLKQIAAGNHSALAGELLKYSKEYVNSPAFRKEYDLQRIASRPVEPEKFTRTKEDIRKEKVDEMTKSISGAEETIKKMPEMEKSLRPTVDLLHKTLKDYQDPNSKMIENMYQYEVYSYNDRVERYKQDLKKWEDENPADYKIRLRKYLSKYLELAATVDFSAALTEKGGKKYFVNQAYEGKPDDWKLVFRAGKEVYSVTRPFAEQWLRELQ